MTATPVGIVRRGGIAGIALRGSGTTADLPPEQAEAAEQALATVNWSAAPAAPPHPDGFSYEISTSDASGDRTRVFTEHELPADLRPLVAHLLA
jgi:hypothetical protein